MPLPVGYHLKSVTPKIEHHLISLACVKCHFYPFPSLAINIMAFIASNLNQTCKIKDHSYIFISGY